MDTSMTTALSPKNVRDSYMRAALDFTRSYGGEQEGQRLLAILRNNDYRDILATCVNENDSVGAFVWACTKSGVDLLQAFYDVGMNVNAKNQDTFCALRNASYSSIESSVRWLIDHDANIDIQDDAGWTPLICACFHGDIAIVQILLQKNANPNILNSCGYTALMYACQFGHKEIVQLLLNYNADIEFKSVEGKTALDLTRNEEIKEMLLNQVTPSYILK